MRARVPGTRPDKLGPALALLLGAMVASQSCSVDDIDLSGKKCPCVDGWTCDEATGRCVESKKPPHPDASLDAVNDVWNDVSFDSPGDAPASPDPFGRVCIGNDKSSSTGANRKRVSRYVLLTSEKVESLVIYVDGKGKSPSSSQAVRGVIYTASAANGEPADLVAATSDGKVVGGQAPGWVVLPFASPVSMDPGQYWLGLHTGTTDSVIHYYLDSAPAGARIADDTFADGTAATFGAPSTLDYLIDVYAKPVGVDVSASDQCPTSGTGGSGGTGGATGGTGGATGGTGGATGGSGGAAGGGGSGGTGGAAGAAGAAGATGGSGGSDAAADSNVGD